MQTNLLCPNMTSGAISTTKNLTFFAKEVIIGQANEKVRSVRESLISGWQINHMLVQVHFHFVYYKYLIYSVMIREKTIKVQDTVFPYYTV